MPTRVLILGHSHIQALRQTHRKKPLRALEVEFLPILAAELPPGTPLSSGPTSARVIEAAKGSAAAAIVSCIGGNEHNVLGLVNHPQRFDFVLAEAPDLPLDAAATVLPAALVRSSLLRLMDENVRFMTALARAAVRPVLQLESPPPVPSEGHIRKHPGVFRDKIETLGVAPALLRFKLWRLYSQLMRQACEEAGVEFVPVPPETQDGDGMMVEGAWNPDPTHGNDWYGRRVLYQLAARLARAR